MYLNEFRKNGQAEISVSEVELNKLCNVLFRYCEDHPEDKKACELHERLYILYEVVHHGACFDDTSLQIIMKLRASYKGNDEK